MCQELRIDFVSPPFAGHLYPQLDLARQLRERGFSKIHFLSTPEAREAVERSGFSFTPVLEGSSHIALEIANTKTRVGSNPFLMLQQLRKNLSLMDQLRSELRAYWLQQRTDLVIADFTLPVAGLLAQSMGLGWWSSMPTICVLETGDGTPSYLGGWAPRNNRWGRIRDAAGNRLTRLFKQTFHRLFRRRLTALGVDRIYRDDGYELVYSRDTILGFGIREFEFPRRWPPALQFVGPLTATPPLPHEPPEFVEGKPHILVSLGTHLWWAKDDACELIRAVAKSMPECIFHFSEGRAMSCRKQIDGNFHVYGYLPYEQYADRYALALNHAGTGVLYSCLRHGLPILAWPQDYDQFDHTARLVSHGLGLRCRPVRDQIVVDLRQLLQDESLRKRVNTCRDQIAAYRTVDLVLERLQRYHSTL